MTLKYKWNKTRRDRAMQERRRIGEDLNVRNDYGPNKYGAYKTTVSSDSVSGMLNGHRTKRKITLPAMPWDDAK